ncbi:hypothetical protein OG802_18690 [Streptomyces sp. NBC_00704]|uniref:hypothetical protein n=1 Tax=Streptomyces sp. NBC_00704 TaxID=2975809 RepID=UPI002E32F33B|nr:hypothetical protein [Streptomyces sp. NBC_00704]
MSAHPPLALAAAALVAFVLLLRWGATHRPRQGRHRPPERTGPATAAGTEGARRALRDAERHLSAHWERLRPLYPHVHPHGHSHAGDTASHDTTSVSPVAGDR